MSESLSLQGAVQRIRYICGQSSGRSQLFPKAGSGYKASVTHYYESSADSAHVAVQPGSVEDLQKIVKVIGEHRVPFAVKSGGHNSNPGFSSVGAEGIQIALTRFNKIDVHVAEQHVVVGAGVLFGELYQALAPHNLNIVGGSGLAGIGVSGWLQGGGISAKTSQYGLGMDNIKSVEIILPDGSEKNVGQHSEDGSEDAKLFFAIKGGGNNFGIVTEYTLKTHRQALFYYNFVITFDEDFDIVRRAIHEFSKQPDNRANLTAVFRSRNPPGDTKRFLTVSCTYDGYLPAVDPFKNLKSIISGELSNHGSDLPPPSDQGSFDFVPEGYKPTISQFYGVDANRSSGSEASDLVVRGVPQQSLPGITQLTRGRWGCVSVSELTPDVIKIVEVKQKEAAKKIETNGGRRVDIGLWSFTTAMFAKSTPSAWPHEKNRPFNLIQLYFTWEGAQNDTFWVNTMKATLQGLRQKIYAVNPASAGLPYFINSTLVEDATIDKLYGSNLEGLKTLRRQYDPHKVMNLTGGFRIPHPT